MPIKNDEQITFNVDNICSITKRLKHPHPYLINIRKENFLGLKLDKIVYIDRDKKIYKKYVTPKDAVLDNENVFFEMKVNEKGWMVAEFFYYPHLEICLSSGSVLQVFFGDVKSLNEYLTNLDLHVKFYHLIH